MQVWQALLDESPPQVAEAVIVEQYRVRYFRTDGRDVEGVDVPFSFSGGITTAVDIGIGSDANVTISVPLVRGQAKQEQCAEKHGDQGSLSARRAWRLHG
ncbi:MAG: hypothetical protein HGA45_39820 [Chloroflexales bacterium]|nr:hypothetical protein [Chloroflexales bacterium]